MSDGLAYLQDTAYSAIQVSDELACLEDTAYSALACPPYAVGFVIVFGYVIGRGPTMKVRSELGVDQPKGGNVYG